GGCIDELSSLLSRHPASEAERPVVRSFFFNNTATTEMYPLSLHDALPIYVGHLILPASAPGSVVHHLRHLYHRLAQLLAGGQHIANQNAQAGDKTIEPTGKITQLIGPALVQPPSEITTAATDLHQGAGDLADRSDQSARQQHHQKEEKQRHPQTDQAGAPQRLPRFTKDLRFRHFADKHPPETLYRLCQRHECFAVALKTNRLLLAAQQSSGRLAAHKPGQFRAVVVVAVRVDHDASGGIDEIDLTPLAEAKPADQLRHRLQAVAQPDGTQLATVGDDALVDEHRRLTRGFVDIDVDTAVPVAIDQAIEPALARVAAVEHPRQSTFGVVMTAGENGDGDSQRPLLRAHPLKITAHGFCLLSTLAIEQPVLNQRIAGYSRRCRNRSGQGALDIVADGGDIGRQRFADQISLSQAIDRRGIHQDDNQDAGQRGCAHADNQLPLDAAIHKAHGAYLGLVDYFLYTKREQPDRYRQA